MLISSKTRQWIKIVRRLPDDLFLQETKVALSRDFDQIFAALKTQKLLSRSRDAYITGVACADIESWTRTAPLSGGRKARLIRHCRATVAFQHMASTLRSRTTELEIWHLSYIDLCAITVTSCEGVACSLLDKLKDIPEPPSSDQAMQMSRNHNFVLRDTLDKAMLVIDEGRRRCAENSDPSRGTPTAFVEALEVARQTDSLLGLWDAYSFSDLPISIVDRTLRVHRPPSHAAQTKARFAHRSHVDDLVQQREYAFGFLELQGQAVETLQVDSFKTFEAFLYSEIANNLISSTAVYADGLRSQIKSKMSKLINLDQIVRIGSYKLTYVEIIDTWAAIYSLAFLAGTWFRAWRKVEEEIKPATISLPVLTSYLSSSVEKNARVPHIIDMFLSKKEARSFQDLFYKPLLLIDTENVILPVSIIEMSRFDRNLLQIVISEVNESVYIKGEIPLREVSTKFRDAGFQVLENYRVFNAEGKIATDIDLLAAKDDILFVFQSKVLGVSDDTYGWWKNGQSLAWAAEQMATGLLYFDVRNAEILKLLGLSPLFSIAPFILTNIWTHSGEKIDGYRVIDFDQLTHILDGAIHYIVDIGRKTRLAEIHNIQDRYPTGKELLRLLHMVEPAPFLPRQEIHEGQMKIGDWTLVMPIERPLAHLERVAQV